MYARLTEDEEEMLSEDEEKRKEANIIQKENKDMKRNLNEYYVNNMSMEILKKEIDRFRINNNLRKQYYNERDNKVTDIFAQGKNRFDIDKNSNDSCDENDSVEMLHDKIEEFMANNELMQERLDKVIKESTKAKE